MAFVKGSSGNPKGRPKTTESEAFKALNEKYMSALMEKLEKNIPAIIDAMISGAKGGDTKLLLTLNEMLYKSRPYLGRPLPTETAADIAKSNDIVIDALSNGDIDASYADSLLNHLTRKRETVVLAEIQNYADKIKKDRGEK